MADVSAEPSMEEILSSIKRIIAEEEGTPARRRGGSRPATPEPDDEGGAEDDTILELSQPLAPDQPVSRPFAPPAVAARPAAQPEPAAALAAPAPATSQPAAPSPATPSPAAPAPAAPATEAAAAEPGEPIVSAHAVDATRGSLDSLSRLIVRPAAAGGDETLEGLVRELLKPMLRDWLDAKLPGIVETMVAREIARISGRDA